MPATLYVVIAMSMYRSRHTGGICLSEELLLNLNLDQMFPLHRAVASSIIRGAHIHIIIFMFTNRKNNRFQKKLIMHKRLHWLICTNW